MTTKKQLLERMIRKIVKEETYRPGHSMTTSILAIKNNSELFEKKIRNNELTIDDVDTYIQFVKKYIKVIENEFSEKR